MVIWSALRFSARWSTLTMLLVAAVAVLGTTLGTGPFARLSLHEGLALLQLCMGAVAVTALIVLAAAQERAKAATMARALEQREASRQQIRAIIDTAHDAFIACDGDGIIVDWNPQATATLGWEAREAIGQGLAQLVIPSRFRAGHLSGMARRKATGVDGPVVGQRIEMVALHRDGHELPVEMTLSSVRLGGQVVFTAFLHDITARKCAVCIRELQLAVTRVLAEAATTNEAFDRSLAAVCTALDWDFGAVWTPSSQDPNRLVLSNVWHGAGAQLQDFVKLSRRSTFHKGEGLPGRVWASGEPTWILDVTADGNFPRVDGALAADLRCGAAFAVMAGGEFFGVIEFFSHAGHRSGQALVETMAEITGRLGFFVQRKRAEDGSRRSEERFRQLVDAVRDYAIIMLDPDGMVTSWNAGAQTLSGYAADEIVGKHIAVFHPVKTASRQRRPDLGLMVAQASGRYEDEGWRLRKDGTLFYANVIITALYDVDGQHYGFSKVTRDITERRRSEDALKQLNEELEARVELRTSQAQRQEKQLRMITDALPTLVMEFDAQERLRFVNEPARRWLETRTRVVLDKTILEHLGADAYAKVQVHLAAARAGGESTFEVEAEQAGKRLSFSLSLIPEFDAQRQVSGYIAVGTDITKHKEAKEAAEAANAAKSAFLANMSHEIRTPLGAVLGFAELLSDQSLTPPERQDFVSVMRRNGELLSSIINDILDLSKVEAGRVEIERQDVALSEVLADTTALLRLQAAEKRIALIVKDTGTAPQTIHTDPLRLRQVLLNIIGNAIKFTRKGQVTVTVTNALGSDGTTRLAFIVEDSGTGISPEQSARLFEPFTQADVSTTRQFGGTGLGLILSRRLANLLGGDVILSHSELGRGSTFVITINPGEGPAGAPAARRVLGASALAGPELQLQGLRVLLVEDSPDNQVLIGRFLKLAGATYDMAENGREALALVAGNDYDVLLMDLQMPIMDGYAATAALRQQGFAKPIIALTAHALQEERRRCLERGFDDHLSKPVDRGALVGRLAQLNQHKLLHMPSHGLPCRFIE